MIIHEHTIHDTNECGSLKTRTRLDQHSMSLYFDGYGEFTAENHHGSPVYLELYDGVLKLYVWADINQEDPTHIIDLSGAKESNRA